MKSRLFYLEQADGWYFQDVFDEVVPIRLLQDDLTKKDVIYFGGGTDVSPSFYGEELHPLSQRPNILRDIFEEAVFKRYVGKIAGFLGICRGSQLLTVLNGGKLIQHVENHAGDHKIVSNDGIVMDATSTHHQMMYPFDLPKKQYEILATPYPKPRSSFYERGDRQEYAQEQVPVEPEIVWYPKSKSLCIQGHPEYMNTHEDFPQHCFELIKKRLLSQ